MVVGRLTADTVAENDARFAPFFEGSMSALSWGACASDRFPDAGRPKL